METLKEAAADGLGIVALPTYVCRHEVTTQRLIPVLPDWSAGDAQISLLMPSRKGIPPVVEAFAAYLQQEFPKVTMT
jgi:DNA-binding transcriptional LysR family regulator